MGAKNLLGKFGKFALNMAGIAGVPGIGVLDKAFNLLETKGMSPETKAELSRLRETNSQELAIVELNADAAKVAEINATIRAEGKSEHWQQYSWRPAIGFAVALQCGSLGIAFSYLIFKIAMGAPFPPDMLMNLSNVMAAMLGLFGLEAGILGVASWKRGQAKIELAKNGE